MKDIDKAILQTLSFYDIYDFPLTNSEIIDNLWGRAGKLDEILPALKQLQNQGKIDFKDGFYFLAGKYFLADRRQEVYINSYKKWQLVSKYHWVWRLVPFLKIIFIANTLAYGNAKLKGDIDLLVITENNRLFTSRLFLTVWLLILGRWRWGGKVSDRFCLSFFLSKNKLNLKDFLIDDLDIYLIYYTKWLKPVYCTDTKAANKFYSKNSWIKKYLPNIDTSNQIIKYDQLSFITKMVEFFLGGFLGDVFESILRRTMLGKIKKNTPENNLDGVWADKDILKFHPQNKRRDYARQWLKKINFRQQ